MSDMCIHIDVRLIKIYVDLSFRVYFFNDIYINWDYNRTYTHISDGYLMWSSSRSQFK